jgi:hypothetical protein
MQLKRKRRTRRETALWRFFDVMPTGPYELKYADDRNRRTVRLKYVVMGTREGNIHSDCKNIFCGCKFRLATST